MNQMQHSHIAEAEELQTGTLSRSIWNPMKGYWTKTILSSVGILCETISRFTKKRFLEARACRDI